MLIRSLALSPLLLLAACADPVDDDPATDQAVVEQSAAMPDTVGEIAEPEADGNVPSLAEVQVALQQCVQEREVLEAQCTATGEGTEFSCTYSLDGDTPETQRETMIAADGVTYVLIDIPEDCAAQ